MLRTSLHLTLGLLAGLPLVAGCGDGGPQRYQVSGTVQYNGQPIPMGTIQFDPNTEKGNDGPQGFAHIHQGQYNTTDAEMSPIGGPHIVRIVGYDGKTGPERPYGQLLFEEYVEQVDLPNAETTLNFEIPESKGGVEAKRAP